MDDASTTVDDVDEIPPVPKKTEKAVFLVVEGVDKGERFEIPHGACRAIGRSLDEAERTRLMNAGSMVSLDDFSKKLVFSYVAKQFGKKEGGAGFAGFQREPDFILQDKSISRLHAVLFFDESGIGILDLVSKNGTFVNGIEIESKILKTSDLIAVGTSKIRFEGVKS